MLRATVQLWGFADSKPVERTAGFVLAWMVTVGFVIRLALILYFKTYEFPPTDLGVPYAPPHYPYIHFPFGWETGQVASSLATGHGFSSPFGGGTGPTTWIGPVYPAMCAFIFKVFGVFSKASGIVILALNGLFSALTTIPMVRIGERTFGKKVAASAGWIWSAGALFMFWPVTCMWDTSVSGLLLAWLFFIAFTLAENSSAWRWIGFGALWAVAALTNPALLAFMPLSFAWPVWHLWKRRSLQWRNVVVAAVVMAALVSPWLVRNRLVMHQWVFIRGNAGFEFHLSNYHHSFGMGWFGKHPSLNKWEFEKYRRLGEMEYVAQAKREAFQFVREYPLEFVQLTIKRTWVFWTDAKFGEVAPLYAGFSLLMLLGLIATLARRLAGALLYLGVIVTYPAVYYLTLPSERYRYAIEPVMLLLSSYVVAELLSDLNVRFKQSFGLRRRVSIKQAEPVTES
ncbi:MAG TPA: glycosyltransferase family 39 protein [Terriglobales bacterium]|nr:glycosyltransferase family 39 protein [Terriglobales bacterium]